MRFYHPAMARVVDVRRPRAWLFLFGPFYLAWLRLWKDAAALAVCVFAIVHVSVGAMRVLLGDAAVGGVPALWRAFEALVEAMRVNDAAAMGDAYRAFIALSLPYYAAAFVLLLVGASLAVWAPQYFAWRYRGLGYVQLQVERQDELELLQEF